MRWDEMLRKTALIERITRLKERHGVLILGPVVKVDAATAERAQKALANLLGDCACRK